LLRSSFVLISASGHHRSTHHVMNMGDADGIASIWHLQASIT
jgi:hypothetical protein